MKTFQPLICLVFTSSLIACGDDDGGGSSSGSGGNTPGVVDSGVDDSKPLSMVTSEELTQIAQSQAAAVDVSAYIDMSCKLVGVFTVALSAGDMPPTEDMIRACNDSYNQCKSQTEHMVDMVDLSMLETVEVPTDTSALAECNVTVGEYEACLTESLALAFSLFDNLTCENPALMVEATEVMVPAACETFQTNCAAATQAF